MPFVYGLIDPRSKLIRYIGYSVNPSRPFAHAKCAKEDWSGEDTHKTNWIRELWYAGFSYEVCILEETPHAELLPEKEQWWIAFFGRQHYGTGVLTNSNDGGVGGLNPSKETRIKLSQSQMGNDKAIGNTNLLGHKHSEESRTKMSLASLRAWESEERRKKLSERSLGNTYASATRGSTRVFSEEHCERLSEAARGRKRSPEERARMSVARLGVKRGPYACSVCGMTGHNRMSCPGK